MQKARLSSGNQYSHWELSFSGLRLEKEWKMSYFQFISLQVQECVPSNLCFFGAHFPEDVT